MDRTSTEPTKSFDLVCGMEVERSSSYTATRQGETYYFCSQPCQEHFVDNPERYAGESE